jgi:hypothetical protein
VLVGRPASTVRGWLRRFRWAALRVAAHFSVWAHRLDPNLAVIASTGSSVGDAVEAVGVAARAASLRLGPRPGWSWASALTGGRLLFNTSSPLAGPMNGKHPSDRRLFRFSDRALGGGIIDG